MIDLLEILSGVLALTGGLLLYFKRGRTWLRQAHEKHLRKSETFGEVKQFIHATEQTQQKLAESLDQVHKSVLRLTLFGRTTSRRVHEQQLEAGKEYLDLGGNGPAAAHYEVLYQDYMERSKANDWRYQPSLDHHSIGRG